MSELDEARRVLIFDIEKALEGKGVFTCDTCPTGGAFGWDMMKHYALEQLLGNPPAGWRITRTYKHECYSWAIYKSI